MNNAESGSIRFIRVAPKWGPRIRMNCWGTSSPPRWADNEIWAEELGLKERSFRDNPHANKKGDLRGKND